MRRETAAELALLISQTWPRGGIATYIWEQTLVDLEDGRAGTAYARLKVSSERAPSIAAFVAVYESLATHETALRVWCSACDGSGQVPEWGAGRHGPACRPELRVSVDEHGNPSKPGERDCGCRAVKPCSCAAGVAFRQTFVTVQQSAPPKPPPAIGPPPQLELAGTDPGF